MTMRLSFVLVCSLVVFSACGGDGTEADRRGVGAQCTNPDECATSQQCLAFKGGYCGLEGCTANAGCPSGSACVRHSDGTNYCFRICVDKAECNRNRSVGNEANCSSNIAFVEAATNIKACVPPSSS